MRLLSIVRLIFIFACTFLFGTALWASPDFLTLQSRIVQPDGQNLEAVSVNYRISITDPIGTCVVYQEDYSNVSMANSKGLISIKIGSGVKSHPVAPTTMKDIFTNFNSPVFNCQSGGTYTAASSDQRKLVMQFNDGSGWQTVPGMEINSVPFALESLSSQKLGAFPAADYVRAAQFATCGAGEAVHFNGTNFTCVVTGGAATSVAAGAGLVGTPSISFSGDTNTGLYSGAADTISISNNGSNTFNITASTLASTTTGGASITQTNGTAGAPTFAFTGDADTGWFRAAADTLAASTAGAERIRIDSAGNVGVGTASPAYPLDIFLDESTNLSARGLSQSMIYRTTGDASGIKAFVSYRSGSPSTGSIKGGDFAASTSNSTGSTLSNMYGSTSTATHVYQLATLSNLIGSLNTATISAVAGSATVTNAIASSNRINSTSSGTISDARAGFFEVNSTGQLSIANAYGVYTGTVNGTNKWSVYASDATAPSYFAGNVGVGTTAPTARLQVVGSNVSSGSAAVALSVQGGNTSAAGQTGGPIYLTGGQSTTSGGGGSVVLTGGAGYNFGGNLDFNGGAGTGIGVGYGGGINLTSGGGKSVGGDVSLSAGTVAGQIMGGSIFINAATGSTSNGNINIGNSNNSNIILGNGGGNVGIGTTTPTSNLEVVATSTATSGTNYLVRGVQTVSPSAATTGSYYGARYSLTHTGSAAGGYLYGAAAQVSKTGIGASVDEMTGTANVVNRSEGNATNIIGTDNYVISAASQTATNAFGTKNQLMISSGSTSLYGDYSSLLQTAGTTAAAYGSYSEIATMGGGAITNSYGYYAGTIGGTNKWSFYASDATARSYFAGNVGIGTATPGGKLEVSNGSGSYVRFDVGNPGMLFNKSTNVSGSWGLHQGWWDGQDLTFLFNGSNPVISMRPSGNVGIGTTSPQTTLQVEGIISPATNNTYTLGNASYRFTEVYATNGVINTSDRREKKDIYNTDLGLDFINKLRPVSYRWNTGVDNEVHYGLIAQEAELAIVEVGKTEKTSIVTHDQATDRYGVRYSELISPLIKAAQELYNKLMGIESDVAALKANDITKTKEIEKLKRENAEMKFRLEELEKFLKSKK